jgi:predicted anti-sigma-YlaC factor YlaD
MSWSLSAILLLVAVVLFLLAAFEIDVGKLNLVTFGFAAFAGSFLVAGWKR